MGCAAQAWARALYTAASIQRTNAERRSIHLNMFAQVSLSFRDGVSGFGDRPLYSHHPCVVGLNGNSNFFEVSSFELAEHGIQLFFGIGGDHESTIRIAALQEQIFAE